MSPSRRSLFPAAYERARDQPFDRLVREALLREYQIRSDSKNTVPPRIVIFDVGCTSSELLQCAVYAVADEKYVIDLSIDLHNIYIGDITVIILITFDS